MAFFSCEFNLNIGSFWKNSNRYSQLIIFYYFPKYQLNEIKKWKTFEDEILGNMKRMKQENHKEAGGIQIHSCQSI